MAVHRILCVLLLLAAAGQSPASDIRQRLSVSAQAEWSAVGRVNVARQGYCTGTLIKPDLVLTAAHCLVDKRTRMVVSPARVRFLAGYRSGSYAEAGEAAAISLIAGFGSDPKVRNDLALIWLQAPMHGGIAPLHVDPNALPGDRVDTLSYGFDRSQTLSRQSGCRVLRRAGALIVTTCEGVPGVSGSPMIRVTDAGPRLVAVASAVFSPRRDGVLRGNLIGVLANHSTLDVTLSDITKRSVQRPLERPAGGLGTPALATNN